MLTPDDFAQIRAAMREESTAVETRIRAAMREEIAAVEARIQQRQDGFASAMADEFTLTRLEIAKLAVRVDVIERRLEIRGITLASIDQCSTAIARALER
jgi:hypothetical protein